MATTELVKGLVISGKYELVEVIGQGGMAHIWRARRLTDGQGLALKFVAPSADADASWRRRFEREARLLSRLGQLSPHVVAIEDHDFDSDSGPFLAMELLSGMTLEERRSPRVINGSRKRRIARGSGTSVTEVNDLLTQFRQMQRLMKQMGGGGKRGGRGGMRGLLSMLGGQGG